MELQVGDRVRDRGRLATIVEIHITTDGAPQWLVIEFEHEGGQTPGRAWIDWREWGALQVVARRE